MTTETQVPTATGVVKQINSGDTIVIRGNIVKDGPPQERTLILSNVTAGKLARKAGDNDEPFAWEAREFLRKKLLGKEVFFTCDQKVGDSNEKMYGKVFCPTKDDNVTEDLVSAGLVSVRREGARQSPDVQNLIELEEKAKETGVGKWGKEVSARAVRLVTENTNTLVSKYGKKPVKAIVELVKDASTLKVLLLPDYVMISTFMISGIRTDNDEFKDEAKFFVEVRLLQHEVEVILESVNKSNTAVIGSVIHPKGNIAELLLKEGFGTVNARTMATVTNGGEKLRAAEKYAKENRMRRWKDFQQPAVTKIANKEFNGVVSEIVSSDCLMIKTTTGELRKIFLSSVKFPREPRKEEDRDKPAARPSRNVFDTPWMYEAKEFLRKKLIGKKVSVEVDYIQPKKDDFPERYCCTVLVGGFNIAEEMVAEGLAVVMKYRQEEDERSPHYDALLTAEEKAIARHVGLHSKEKPKYRINDCTGNLSKVKGLLPMFQRASKLEAVVEYVISGSRMRIFLPKDSVILTFLLSGIYCPRATSFSKGGVDKQVEEYGEEALNFVRDKVLQRDVEIKIENCDKVGNVIGWLFVDNKNLAILMVEEGLSWVHHISAERTEYYRALTEAEERAKAKKLNYWSTHTGETKSKVEDEVKERTTNYKKVRVTIVTKDLHVYFSNVDEAKGLEELEQNLNRDITNSPLTCPNSPKKGEIFAAKYDGMYYRAKVEKIHGQKAQVLYVDYGNQDEVPVSDLVPLPSSCVGIKPFAHEYALACVRAPPEEYLADVGYYLYELLRDKVLAINEENQDQGVKTVTVVDDETKEDLIKTAVGLGYFIVEKRVDRKLRSYRDELFVVQKEAMKKRLCIWEYGDITEDDSGEFGTVKK